MRIEGIMGKAPAARKRSWTIALAIPLCAAQIGLAAALVVPSADLVRMPAEGKITSAFGLRIHPVTKQEKRHKGMDIAAPQGTEVIAAGTGVVTFAAEKGKYGNLIAIDHGDDTVTRYAQLFEIDVAVGDRVLAGQRIGSVGSTGQSTGPHLHFEVIIDGKHVDPAAHLPAQN